MSEVAKYEKDERGYWPSIVHPEHAKQIEAAGGTDLPYMIASQVPSSPDVRANVNTSASWLSFACWAAEYEARMRRVGVRVWPKEEA